jgi:hypothetical protein
VLAIVPATVIAVVVAYHANLLATPDPTTAAAVHQGHRVALVVAICAAAAGLARWPLRAVDRRLTRRRLLPAIAARTRWAALAVVILVAVVVAVAAGAPSSLAHQYDRFVAGASTNTQDLRARLLDPSSNGRSQHWKVAINAFSNAAFKGHGAGSYELDWDLHRPNGVRVLDAHGLYFETASELGLVGTALLVVVIFVVLGGLTMRSLGPRRSLEAALLAAALVWVVHAGVDWDWEVAATTFPFFAIGGLVLARPATLAENQPQRPLIAVGVVAAAVMPFLLLGSQTRLDTSADAFRRDDCAKANSKALSSISILPFRPEPYEVIGYCDIELGRPAAAVRAMRNAVNRDPGMWEYRYGLAVAQAAAGIDPRTATAQALERNPNEALARQLAANLGQAPRGLWERRGVAQANAMLDSGLISLP